MARMTENEEIQDENECLSRRHKEMKPSRSTIDYITVRLGPSQRHCTASQPMNRLQLRALLDEVRGRHADA